MSHAPEPGAVGAPASYGLAAARPGEALPWSQVEDWLSESRNYWVSTTRPDGRPHAMPVWGVWLDSELWFSSDPQSRKGRNLAVNPEVVVHTESGDDVAILEGAVTRPGDAGLLSRFVEAYEGKYGHRIEPSDPPTGIYTLRPRVAFAWRERDFPTSATRWTF